MDKGKLNIIILKTDENKLLDLKKQTNKNTKPTNKNPAFLLVVCPHERCH